MLLLLPLDGIELTDVPQGYIGLAGTGLALTLRNGRRGLGRFDELPEKMHLQPQP